MSSYKHSIAPTKLSKGFFQQRNPKISGFATCSFVIELIEKLLQWVQLLLFSQIIRKKVQNWDDPSLYHWVICWSRCSAHRHDIVNCNSVPFSTFVKTKFIWSVWILQVFFAANYVVKHPLTKIGERNHWRQKPTITNIALNDSLIDRSWDLP